jgi:tellurite resistance protein TerC
MTPLSHWLYFHLALVALLGAEYALHLAVPGTRRKATAAILLWTTASLALAAVLVPHYHALGAQQYLASYALEQSLSIDNLFVFLLLFRLFGIPAERQPKVLFWGVTGAILMRGAFIAGGLTLLHRFSWISYIFAAVLLIAAVRLVLPHNQTNSTPRWITWLTRLQPVSDNHDHFFVREDGRRQMTILFLALLAVELTDVVFALDSIPAVLSITRVPFLAYTSNIMAVMCLRSLYVLLAEALSRLRYLHFGLAAVLAFAALKMLLANLLDISPLLSLAIIAALLTAPITASLLSKPQLAS